MLVWLKSLWFALVTIVTRKDRKTYKKGFPDLSPQDVLDSLEEQYSSEITLPFLEPVPWRKDTWMLLEDWRYKGWFIPKYFFCDLDSIPRIPYVYSFFKGYGRISAFLHDWHYATEEVSRKQADRVFYDLLKLEGVHPVRARLAFWGVRVGGWYSYGKRTGVYDSLMAPEVRNAPYPNKIPLRS